MAAYPSRRTQWTTVILWMDHQARGFRVPRNQVSLIELDSEGRISEPFQVCGDKVCLQPMCKAARESQVKLVVWLPVSSSKLEMTQPIY